MSKLQLDDSIVKYIETAKSEELKESRDLILRIRRRDLYQVIKITWLPWSEIQSLLRLDDRCDRQSLWILIMWSQFCNEFTVPKDQLEYFKDVTPQDIICSQVCLLFLFLSLIWVIIFFLDMTELLLDRKLALFH